MTEAQSAGANRIFACQVDSRTPTPFRSTPGATSHRGCDVVYRGWIANLADLRARLGEPHSDPAMLLAAGYRRWGRNLQKFVLGEFSCVVFDRDTQDLFATTDALGIRPLFYAPGAPFRVASNLERLASELGDKSIDRGFVYAGLRQGYSLQDDTIYRAIRRLLPGQSLVWRRDRLSTFQTWSLDEAPDVRHARASEYDEHFRELLFRSIADAQSGTTWAELSGGLDSATVICAGSRVGQTRLEALSFTYPGFETADETPWAAKVVEHLGVPWHTIDVTEAMPFSRLPDVTLPGPGRTALVWAQFRAYEDLLRSHGVNTILAGQGGDQVFYGDSPLPVHVADLLLAGHPLRMYRAIRQYQKTETDRRSLLQHFIDLVGRPVLSYARHRQAAPVPTFDLTCPWMSQDFRTRFEKDIGATGSRARLSSVALDSFNERLSHFSCAAGQTWNQYTSDFQVRYPLLARPLVAFLARIPVEQHFQGSEGRILHRRALQGLLPEAVRIRQDKKGPDQAYFEALRTNPTFRNMLTDRSRLVEAGFVDPAGWRAAVERAQFGQVPSLPTFLFAVALEIWLRQT